MLDKSPNETYLAHAQELLAHMEIETDGKPTWEYDLIVALSTAHSDVHAVEILRHFAERVRFKTNTEYAHLVATGQATGGHLID